MVAMASPNTGNSWGLAWGHQAWLCPFPCHAPDIPGAGQGEFLLFGLSAPLQVAACVPASAAGCPGHRQGLHLFFLKRPGDSTTKSDGKRLWE